MPSCKLSYQSHRSLICRLLATVPLLILQVTDAICLYLPLDLSCGLDSLCSDSNHSIDFWLRTCHKVSSIYNTLVRISMCFTARRYCIARKVVLSVCLLSRVRYRGEISTKSFSFGELNGCTYKFSIFQH